MHKIGDVLLRFGWCTGGVPRPRLKVLGQGLCQGEWRSLGSAAQRGTEGWDMATGLGGIVVDNGLRIHDRGSTTYIL